MKIAYSYDETIGHLCIHYNDSHILHIFDMEGRDVYRNRTLSLSLLRSIEEALFLRFVYIKNKEATIKEHWRQS